MAENYNNQQVTTAEFAMGELNYGCDVEDMGCTPGNHSSGQQGTK